VQRSGDHRRRASVRCRHCTATIAIPDVYRAPARSHASAARDLEAAARAWRWVHRLRAGETRTALVAFTLLVAVYWCSLLYAAALGMLEGYKLFLVPFFAGAVYLVVGLWRISLRPPAPTLRLAVAPAARDREANQCATCGAPIELPPAAFVLAPCLHCGTEHLLGRRAGRRAILAAARVEHAAVELLDATVALRDRVSRLIRRVALACWLFVGLTLAIVAVGQMLGSMHDRMYREHYERLDF
jgi:hypothetical protein